MKRAMLVLGLLMLNGATCLQPPSGDTGSGGQTTNQERKAALRTFQSAEEARTYFAEQAIARLNNQYALGSGLACGALAPAGLDWSMDYATGAESRGGPTPTNGDRTDDGDVFSSTNTQESGVDESDVVKNDGNHFFLLKDNTLRIVKANPADDLQQVAKVDLPASADSLYRYGKKLVALSQTWGFWGYIEPVFIDGVGRTGVADAMPPGEGSINQTIVTILDVTDPAAPVTRATLKFDGNLVSSRMIGGKLHLVMTATPKLPDNPTPEAIRAQPLDAWLPDYAVTRSDGSTQSGKALGWQDFYYPANPDGYGITLVITVDVDKPDGEFQPVAISANAGTIYASASALYVTDTRYDYAWNYREDTVIHKFDLTGEAARYAASGLVPGRLLNQYSLGEKDGYLRLASSISNYSGPIVVPLAEGGTGVSVGQPSQGSVVNGHAVYVLHESADTAGKLDIVGRLEGIEPDEDLFSARFIGNRGFIVTFKNVDPLFTIDLSVPENPVLVGKLVIPGYSDYIHPLGEDYLLTIGKDASADMGNWAWYQGVQLTVFNVKDLKNPKIDSDKHKVILGTRGTNSEANSNPKAFNYFKDAAALAIPIDLYEGPTTGPEYGIHTFTGLYVFHVTGEDGFEFLGRIPTVAVTPNPYYGYYGGDWPAYTRGIFVNDAVYAVTDDVVKSAPLASPSTLIDSLTLP